MSYLGRRGATAPLNSADIPDDVVQGTDIAYLENDSGKDIGGTYSTERLYLSGRTGSAPNDYNYRLTDNVTVTGHLALGSVADSDVVITQDSTERTITGSGTIEGGNLLQNTHSTSVTGMTGELGSTVTGSPNLNLTTGTLGSGVTFPAGHVVGISTLVNFARYTGSDISTSSTTHVDLGWEVNIIPNFSAGSSILRMHLHTSGWGGSSANQEIYTTFCRSTSSGVTSYSTGNDCALGLGVGTTYAGGDTTRGTSKAIYTNRTMIDSKTHSASTTYYYRFFWRTGSGNAVRITNSGAELFFYVEEIKI